MGREMNNTAPNQKPQSEMSYTVEQLVAVNPYNPDILPDLENYVNEQVRRLAFIMSSISVFVNYLWDLGLCCCAELIIGRDLVCGLVF